MVRQRLLIQLDHLQPRLAEREAQGLAHGKPLRDRNMLGPAEAIFEQVANPAGTVHEQAGSHRLAAERCQDLAQPLGRQPVLACAPLGDGGTRFGTCAEFVRNGIGFERQAIAVRMSLQERRGKNMWLARFDCEDDDNRAAFLSAKSQGDRHGMPLPRR